MLTAFGEAISSTSRARLHDSERVAPFANLRTGTGAVKEHGITGATGDLSGGDDARPGSLPPRPRPPQVASAPPAGPSQPTRGPVPRRSRARVLPRLTARDLAAGQVRIPRAAKRLFPTERRYLDTRRTHPDGREHPAAPGRCTSSSA